MNTVPNVLITELARFDIVARMGGTMSALVLEIELPPVAGASPDEPSMIVITDTGGTVVPEPEYLGVFHGWMACYFENAEDMLYGNVKEYVYGDVEMWGDSDKPIRDWRIDARAMACTVNAFLKDRA